MWTIPVKTLPNFLRHYQRIQSRYFCILFVGIAVIFLLFSFRYGIEKKYDQIFPAAVEYQNVNLASAVTRYIYGLDYGFAADIRVYNSLRKNGVTQYKWLLDPLGVEFPDNLRDSELLNNALQEAAKLGSLEKKTKVFSDVKPIEPSDLGMALFFELSFRTFGYEISSFYKFYYFILVVTAFLFIAGFYDRPIYLGVFAILCAVHFIMVVYIEHGITGPSSFGVATVYAPRFISALGIIPSFHVASTLFSPPRKSFIHLLSFIPQAAMLGLAFTIRVTIMWGIIWVISIVLIWFAILLFTRCARATHDDTALGLLVRRMLSWPLAIFAIVIVFFNIYWDGAVNPVYRFADETIPRHMTWHSVYYGLTFHPEWEQRFAAEHSWKGKVGTGDALPTFAAFKYLKEKYDIDESYIISPLYGNKYKTLERVIREVYFEFIKENPIYFLETYFIHKPIIFLKHYSNLMSRTVPKIGIIAFCLIGVLLVSLFFLVRLHYESMIGELLQSGTVLSVGFLVSLTPIIIGFPGNNVLGDQIFMLNALFGMAMVGGAVFLARFYHRIRGRAI